MFTSHQLPTGLSFSHGASAQAPWLNTQANKIHALIALSSDPRSGGRTLTTAPDIMGLMLAVRPAKGIS